MILRTLNNGCNDIITESASDRLKEAEEASGAVKCVNSSGRF